MDGIYERYINYGEFKELVEGKDGWVRDLMMSIGLGDIRSREKPSKNVSCWSIIDKAISFCMVAGGASFGVPCFTQDLEDSFFTIAYEIYNYFKTIGDYNLMCDFRSRVASYRAHIADYGRMKQFISEIDACLYDLLEIQQSFDDVLLIERPLKEVNDYPIASKEQLSYLSNYITDGNERKHLLNDDTKIKLYRRIYDITEEWEITDRYTPRKWRILLEVLCRIGAVKSNDNTKYRDYARYIVKYCIGDAYISFRRRIAKCSLEESYTNWSNNDKKMYGKIKKDIFPAL